MAGKYMHEQALTDAYKKLYMLGGPGHARRKAAEKDLDQQVVGAFSGIDKAYADKLARDKAASAKLREQLAARKKQEAADAEQMDADVRYIKDGPEAFHEYNQVREGNAVPTNPYAEELSRQNADREAALTRIGGVYTPQGLKMADKEATLNAQDRLMLRSMIPPQPGGLAGSVPMQPRNAMDNYRIQGQGEPVPDPEDSLSTYRGY